ncbi:MAG: hypothetical protein AVDCRST_MAG11-2233, partial [uncultured Gemmatimonadaceae bacterium]
RRAAPGAGRAPRADRRAGGRQPWRRGRCRNRRRRAGGALRAGRAPAGARLPQHGRRDALASGRPL